MDYFLYACSFSITDYIPIIKLTNGKKIPTIVDSLGQDNKLFIILNDILLTCISRDYFDEIKSKMLYELDKSNIDGLFIGAFTKNEIPFLDKNFKLIPSIQSICAVSQWTMNGKAKRCIKRSLEKGVHAKLTYNKDEIYTGLRLVKNMDYYNSLSLKQHLTRLCDYYLTSQDTKTIVALLNNEIVAIMTFIINGEKIHMMEHYYDPRYLGSYINDNLYYQIIEFAKRNGVNMIEWGTTNVPDTGLLRMKKKYSTKQIQVYSLVYLRKGAQ